MSIDERAFEATFARMTRNISDETAPAGYKWAMQFIKHYEGAKPIGKTLIADEKENVWRDDSGDIWEPVRARASKQESSAEWLRGPIDTMAINDGMHFEIDNMVPVGEVWFTDKNNRVIGKIKNIGGENQSNE